MARVAAGLGRAEALSFERSAVAPLFDDVPILDASEQEAVRLLLDVVRDDLSSVVAESSAPVAFRYDYSHIIGSSPALLRLFSLLDKVVGNDSTILIQGENGTGKELFARAVHANSRRRDQAFVTQNCSALNDNLLDSELFGHRRGAFTGAVADKLGLFELADGGTLLLDEIGDMSPMMQAKLLRVLQEGTFLPVGDTVTRKVDVRIIAASNRRLGEMVRERQFREDLFYRLNVICLDVPPLRRRRVDVPLLVEHFITAYASRSGTPRKTMSDETMRLLFAHDWPGNVRELRHEVERLIVLTGSAPVVESDLVSRRIVEAIDPNAVFDDPGEDATLPEAVQALERRMIMEALEQTGWNKTRAAKRLGVSRRNFIRKVQTYKLKPRSL
jgi:transcriptional regulator with PAS, ATPase and Fis domain